MKLYLKYISIHLRCAMQYKASFFLTLIGQVLTSFTAFLSMYYLFERFSSIEGFTFSQVLLCFAVILLSFSLSECFARGFDLFPNMIGNGEFDRILIRPKNEIFQILASKMEFTRLGRVIQAICIFCYAIPHSEVIWTFDKILTLIFMIIGGFLVFSGIFILYAVLCFFTLEGLEFMNILTNGAMEYGKYPFSIYGKQILKFLTYIVPLALVQYYPFLYLIGHSQNHFYIFLPLIASLFLIPCFLLWKFGVKHYQSTGS